MKKKEIGILGGSFDPIHYGHINLALEMLEKKNLEKVILIPTYISPHKIDKKDVASKEDRLKMIKLAIKDIDGVEVDDIEIRKKGISYTIDTLKILKTKYFNMRFIFSFELFKDFSAWKGYKEILQIAPPLIGKSVLCQSDIDSKNFINIRCLEISSTILRNRIKKGLYCGHLTNKEVLDFIYKNNIY